MAITVDYGSLGVADFPEGVTQDELNNLAHQEYDRRSAVEAKRQEQIEFNQHPWPELFPGYKYIDPIVRANAPMLAAFGRGAVKGVESLGNMWLATADLPVETAEAIAPSWAPAIREFTQPRRVDANLLHVLTENYLGDIKNVPPVSPETWTQAYREGPASFGMKVGETLTENTPQILASVALVPLIAALGIPTATAMTVAPMVLTGILEASGSMDEQMQKTGKYSPRSAVSVGIVNALLEKYGLGKLLHQLDADKLLPTKGLIPAAVQIAKRAVGAFGREMGVEGVQEVTAMNIPPMLSDQPWIPLKEQAARVAESAGIGGLLGTGVSAGVDANTLSANRILWDENLQDAVRQKILAEDQHRARAEAIIKNPPPVIPPPMASVVPPQGSLSSEPVAFPPPINYWDYSDPFSPAQPGPAAPAPMVSSIPAPGSLNSAPIPAPAAAPVATVPPKPQDDQFTVQAKAEAEKGTFFNQEHETNWINLRAAQLRAGAVLNQFGRVSPEYVAALQAVNQAWSLPQAPVGPAPKANPLAAVRIFRDARGLITSLLDLTGGKFSGPVNEVGNRPVVLPNGQQVWVRPRETIPEQLRVLEENTKAPPPAPPPAPVVPKVGSVSQEKVSLRERIVPGDTIELKNKSGVIQLEVRNSPDGLVATDGTVTVGLEPQSPNHFFSLLGAVPGTKMKIIKAKAPKVVKPANALRPKTTAAEVLGRTPQGQSALTKVVAKVVAPIAAGTRSALRVVSEATKGARVRQSEAVNKEAGNRFTIADKVAAFFADFKTRTETERNPEVLKSYNDILTHFTTITGRVDDEFNKEHENVIGKATAQKLGTETGEGEELPTHQPEFLSEYRQMIVNQVDAAFVSFFDKTLADAKAEHGDPEAQEGSMADEVRQKVYKQVAQKIKSWNLQKAYSNARNKAYTLFKDKVAKPMSPEKREAEKKKAEKAKVKLDRATAKANEGYFNARNPWGGLDERHRKRVRYYITRLYNNLPLVQRYGIDQVSPHDEGKIDIENVESYPDYLSRTKGYLNEFVNLIKMGDKNNPYLNLLFVLVADKTFLEHAAKPPDMVAAATKGKTWADLAGPSGWAPLTKPQRETLIAQLNEAFGEKVAARFKVDPEVEAGEVTKEWRLSLNATKPAGTPLELEDLVVVLDKIFGGRDRRPTNVYVGDSVHGAVASATFYPGTKNRQRVNVDLNLAESRDDLEDRVREEILHIVYNIKDPIFRRAVTQLTPAQIKEMQDLYYNITFDDSYHIFKEGGYRGEALKTLAYARTRAIIDEEAALRVLIKGMKQAKPTNAAVRFFTKMSSQVRTQFGLKVTPREAALKMEKSVNRFLEHEKRWQDNRTKNNLAAARNSQDAAVNPDAITAPAEAAPSETRTSLPTRDDAFYKEAYKRATEQGLTVEMEMENPTTGKMEKTVEPLTGKKAMLALKEQKGVLDQLRGLRECIGKGA